MTIHIGAQPGEIAETVLLPGDPLRAKWAAETFLERCEMRQPSARYVGFHGVLARQPCHHSGIWHGHAEPVYLRQ